MSAIVSPKGNWFVAQCLEVDIASQGETEDEALENLQDALSFTFLASGRDNFAADTEIKLDVAAQSL